MNERMDGLILFNIQTCTVHVHAVWCI